MSVSKTSSTESNALIRREQGSGEMATTGAVARERYEIESAYVMARQFPRNEQQAFDRLKASCEIIEFAEDVAYSYPRGKKKVIEDDGRERWVDNIVIGPSSYIAREIARVWGNLRYGVEIIRDDEESRTIRAYCLDLETNARVSADDEFKKLVQRKRDGVTQWVIPDERDLRELSNKRAAIAERNCILRVVPKYMADALVNLSEKTIASAAAKDPEATRKRLLAAFASIRITQAEIETKLGHALAEATAEEIAELRRIYKSIVDGQSTWEEYIRPTQASAPAETGTLDVSDLKPSQEENRGHDDARLGDIAEPPKKGRKRVAEGAIDMLQVAAFNDHWDEKGLSDAVWEDFAKEFKVKSPADLTNDQFEAAIEWIGAR